LRSPPYLEERARAAQLPALRRARPRLRRMFSACSCLAGPEPKHQAGPPSLQAVRGDVHQIDAGRIAASARALPSTARREAMRIERGGPLACVLGGMGLHPPRSSGQNRGTAPSPLVSISPFERTVYRFSRSGADHLRWFHRGRFSQPRPGLLVGGALAQGCEAPTLPAGEGALGA
jgi:hypothetical protein